MPFALRRRGVELKLVAGTRHSVPVSDATLVFALARAHRWVRAMRDGRSLTSIAQAERTSEAYVRMRAPLAFLAPRIQAAILAGTQPPEMTLERMVRMGVPLDWDEQGRVLGIDAAG